MSTETRQARRRSDLGTLRRRPGSGAPGFVSLLALCVFLLVVPTLGLAGDGDRDTAASLAAASQMTTTTSAGMQLADLDGRWRQLEDDGATRDRLASIDSAVAPLSWVVRKMASGVLRSSTAPRPTLDFIWDGNRLHERVPGKDRVEARLVAPGAPAFSAIDPRGEPFEGAWDWTREGLRLRWRQHQAHGTNLYRMSADKRTLTVDHTIQVTALDGLRPIAYRSRFAKDALPAVASDGAQRER